MADLWREAARRRIIGANAVRSLARLVRGTAYMVDNRRMLRFVRAMLPPGIRTFGQLAIPLYVTLAHLRTHTLYVYGDDPTADIAEAIVASAAVPGFFPPLVHAGELFVDGGVVSNLPVQLAIARGATEIWAIDLANVADQQRKPIGALRVISMSVMPVIYNKVLHELELGLRTPGITLHHIPYYDFQNVTLGNFGLCDAMFETGKRVMQTYLANPRPNSIQYPHHLRGDELPAGPAGTRPFIP
jgi:NTE family protein